MKVSIITVVYNNQSTIIDAINSVVSQSYNNIEYIVIDGNSTDGTLAILKSRERDIDMLVSESDNGIYDAINKGIKLASGNIVGILNSDDFFADDGVVQRVVDAFDSDKSIDAVYSNVLFVDDSKQKTLRYYSSKNFSPWMFWFGLQPAHPTFYAKKDVFKKHGLYRTDLKIAGDFELLLRMILKYKIKYKYIEDTWVKMRKGGVSTSGWKSIKLMNAECSLACRLNGVYSFNLMIYSKYLVKWWGFLFRKSL